MIICVGCKKEMRCDKNGISADFGHGHVYPSDRFKCPVCEMMVLHAVGSIYDPDYNCQREYLKIRVKGEENGEVEEVK